MQSQIAWLAEKLLLPNRLRDVAVSLLNRYQCLEIVKTGKNPGCGERANAWGITATSAALVLLACRQEGVPRGFRELSKATNISAKAIFRKFCKVSSLLQENGTTLLYRPEPAQFLPRFCSSLGLGFSVEKQAREILKKGEECGSAVSMAAAAVLAVHDNACLHQLVRLSKVSAPTLRKLAKRLKDSNQSVSHQVEYSQNGRGAGTNGSSAQKAGCR